MPKKIKLDLENLNVESFITKTSKILGGAGRSDLGDCETIEWGGCIESFHGPCENPPSLAETCGFRCR